MDSAPSKRTVVIADDHVMMSEAMSEKIDRFGGYEVLYTAINGAILLDKLANASSTIPNIIIMDVDMPVMDGLEATEIIKQKYPAVKVLALSLHKDETNIIGMFRAGARGYLSKDETGQELELALKTISETGYYISERRVNPFQQSFEPEEQMLLKKEALSEKDKKFISLSCSELTYAQIADKMCLSPSTINGYRDVLFKKLHVKTRVGLVLYAIIHGFYKP